MNKKLFLAGALASMLVLCVGVLVGVPRLGLDRLRADPIVYHMELTSSTEVVAKENGAYHQVDIRNNKIDIVGYESTSGKFASIKKATHGAYVYNGMVYNRSAINGFETLRVTYSGGQLYYVFSDFLMENMDFNGTLLASGSTIDVPNNEAYFIIYNESTTKVDIESMDIGYLCDHSIDEEMIHWNSSMGGARSYAGKTTEEDSFIELQNNPTKKNNNYSVGARYKCHICNKEYDVITGSPVCPYCSDASAANQKKVHDFPWYRFNGRYLSNSVVLGTDFTFGMTIAGEYSKMTDLNENFHYNVWPQFDYGNSNDRTWIQTYIGNDNYEPLGKDNPLHPDDPYTEESYSGRFFTRYGPCAEFALWSDSLNSDITDGSGNIIEFLSLADAEAYIAAHAGDLPADVEAYEEWKFNNPDIQTIAGDPSMTLRQAYNAYTLPFWFVKFHVYLDGSSNEAMVDVFINGFHIYTEQIFEHYDTVNTPDIKIWTLPMHVVNYGVDTDGNPDAPYTGTFTKPRLITAA